MFVYLLRVAPNDKFTTLVNLCDRHPKMLFTCTKFGNNIKSINSSSTKIN